MVKYDTSTIGRLVAMARDGASRAVIARRLDMPQVTIAYHCAAAGIDSPRCGQGQRTAFAPGSTPYTPEDDARLVAMLNEGKSYSFIADAMGRNRSSIRSGVMSLLGQPW